MILFIKIKSAVQHNPTVNVISISPSSTRFKRDTSKNPLDVLAAIIYTSNADQSIDQIQNNIQQSGNGLQILHIVDENTISQTNYSTNLCSKVNPIGLGTNQTTTTSSSPSTTSFSATTLSTSIPQTTTPTCPPCPSTPSCPSTQVSQTTTQGVTSTMPAGATTLQPTSIPQTSSTQGGVTSTSMEPTTRTTVPITTTFPAGATTLQPTTTSPQALTSTMLSSVVTATSSSLQTTGSTSSPYTCGSGTWTMIENRCFTFDPIGSTPTQQPISTTVGTTTKPVNITCGTGVWTNIENRCFTFVGEKLDWIAASSHCHSLDGWLTTVFDVNDEKFLYGTTSVTATTQGGVTSTSMKPTTRTTVPITTTCDNSTWINIENRCFLFAPVGATTLLPTTTPPQALTSTTSSSATTVVTITASTTTTPFSCGNGTWTLVENRCFIFLSNRRDWIAASSQCHSLNGFLVTVYDKKDEDFLHNQAGTIQYFIGLNDVARNGTWIWDQPTGQTLTFQRVLRPHNNQYLLHQLQLVQPFLFPSIVAMAHGRMSRIDASCLLNDTKFTNWAQGQPNLNDTSYDHRCVVDQKDVGWVVMDCMTANFYACEKAGTPITATTTQATSTPVVQVTTPTTTASSLICNSYITLVVDNTNDITSANFNLQVSYLNDTQNGLLSLYNQNLSPSYYTETGDDYSGGYTYQTLLGFINTQLTQTSTKPNWNLLLGLLVADAPNDYPPNATINHVLLLGSAPTGLESKITELVNPSLLRTVIGVLLNDQVDIPQSLIDAGLQIIPWNNNPVTLTKDIRNLLKC
uniref:C-type lectin domain-containing protein n=1 Tax=Acrobeloides nanus TaxID=290746 RepID=A0A914DWH7_9BILA